MALADSVFDRLKDAFIETDATVQGGAPALRVRVNGNIPIGGNVTITSAGSLNWGSSGTATPDVFLYRDKAATLAQRNGATAQNLRIYNTFTAVDTDGEWISVNFTATLNVATIQTNAGSSTGTVRAITIQPATQIATAAGANVSIVGGTGTGSGSNGGNIAITSGARGTGSSLGGNITLTISAGSGSNIGPSVMSFVAGSGGTTSSGTAIAGSTFVFTGAAGGANTNASGTGGNGSTFTFTGGNGAACTGATAPTGGAGGGATFTLGAGAATATASTTATGGAGGGWAITTGVGGAVSAAVSGVATGGAGGGFAFTASAGGAVTATTGTNQGGVGGGWTVVLGNGGAASAATDTGGAGGAYAVTTGNGGNGDTGGASGGITFTTGSPGTGGSPAVGTIVFRTNGANTRLTIADALVTSAVNVAIAATKTVVAASGVIGFSVVSTALTLGSAGSVILPNANMSGAANDAARDALAGNLDGAIAIDTGVAGRIYIRDAGAWKFALAT